MIEDGSIRKLNKREALDLYRERDKLERSIGGIKEMTSLPDALFVIDVGFEKIAIDEARKLGIPVVGVVDTNCSPENIDVVIPGNDDAIRAIRIYTQMVADAILTGRGSKGQFSGYDDSVVETQEAGDEHEPGKPAEAQAESKATQNSVIQESQGEAEPTATASLGDVAAVPAEEPTEADPNKADR